ncbi:DNA 3'-phosphatase [Edhazardia aedis USNM 41457]|uniref:DNA 3'-phosphatase n=1 Tax=Edhazardia aedis (strain USNM 41457) TaxID=1003232 RepID=J9DMC2_EDHAE|nr:DNA 3'-phosphatase [Edhazardia aedis USNM 41457]|eukprot:EJW03745.1 DNA 3'-phosphatase [Edhazardia aedis USNM 41457]
MTNVNEFEVPESESMLLMGTLRPQEHNVKAKLALFDLDDTLCKYTADHSVPFNKYFLYYPHTKEKLEKLNDDDYNIAIISNQYGLKSYENLQRKLKWLLSLFDFPILFIGALKYDENRKPSIGMYNYIIEKYFHGNPDLIDNINSFFWAMLQEENLQIIKITQIVI